MLSRLHRRLAAPIAINSTKGFTAAADIIASVANYDDCHPVERQSRPSCWQTDDGAPSAGGRVTEQSMEPFQHPEDIPEQYPGQITHYSTDADHRRKS